MRGYREPRLVVGRNYVETIILTYEQMLLEDPEDLGLQEHVTLRLEEILCSIALTLEYIRNLYHDKIYTMLGDLYPDLPRPQFSSCFVYHTLLDWMNRNKEHVIEQHMIMPYDKVLESIKKHTIHIIRTAILSSLVEAGIIKIT